MNGKEVKAAIEAGKCPDCDEDIMTCYDGDGKYYCEDCGFEIEANALAWL